MEKLINFLSHNVFYMYKGDWLTPLLEFESKFAVIAFLISLLIIPIYIIKLWNGGVRMEEDIKPNFTKQSYFDGWFYFKVKNFNCDYVKIHKDNIYKYNLFKPVNYRELPKEIKRESIGGFVILMILLTAVVLSGLWFFSYITAIVTILLYLYIIIESFSKINISTKKTNTNEDFNYKEQLLKGLN